MQTGWSFWPSRCRLAGGDKDRVQSGIQVDIVLFGRGDRRFGGRSGFRCFGIHGWSGSLAARGQQETTKILFSLARLGEAIVSNLEMGLEISGALALGLAGTPLLLELARELSHAGGLRGQRLLGRLRLRGSLPLHLHLALEIDDAFFRGLQVVLQRRLP